MKKTLGKIDKKGLTLLEILIVIVIIASSSILGGALLFKKENSIKKAFRQLIALNRQLDHISRLKRESYRWAIKLGKKESAWWVEKKVPYTLIPKENTNTEDQSAAQNGYVMDTDVFRTPQKLPSGLYFESVELSGQEKQKSEGIVYIYYFPEGQFNTAFVKIKGKKEYWSLFIDRMQGDLTIFVGEKSLKDMER